MYWRAASISRRAADYPDQVIRLPDDASPEAIADLCQSYTARLKEWLGGRDRPRYLYDGTIGSLCDAFERHPHSPIHEVKWNTAQSYADSLTIIRHTIGQRAVAACTGIDGKRWFTAWEAPRAAGGPLRTTRAHDAISMLRAILRFGGALGHRECRELAEELGQLRFRRARRRMARMTVQQVEAFIATALAEGRLAMAIGVATQFELMIRQKDVIGEYGPDGLWSGSYAWEGIPGGKWRMATSKTATPAIFDLMRYDMLWPLLQAVPQAERHGPIVKGHDGQAMREGRYRKLFRQIAGKAGLPKDVWSMDGRAGGVTEALESGADITDVARAATHADEVTTARYDRMIEHSITSIAEMRKAGRKRP